MSCRSRRSRLSPCVPSPRGYFKLHFGPLARHSTKLADRPPSITLALLLYKCKLECQWAICSILALSLVQPRGYSSIYSDRPFNIDICK